MGWIQGSWSLKRCHRLRQNHRTSGGGAGRVAVLGAGRPRWRTEGLGEMSGAAVMTILARNRSARRRCAMAALAALTVAALAAPVQAQSLKDLSGALGSVTGGSGGLPVGRPGEPQQPDRRARILPEEQISGGRQCGSGQLAAGQADGLGQGQRRERLKAGSGGMLDTGGGDCSAWGGVGSRRR